MPLVRFEANNDPTGGAGFEYRYDRPIADGWHDGVVLKCDFHQSKTAQAKGETKWMIRSSIGIDGGPEGGVRADFYADVRGGWSRKNFFEAIGHPEVDKGAEYDTDMIAGLGVRVKTKLTTSLDNLGQSRQRVEIKELAPVTPGAEFRRFDPKAAPPMADDPAAGSATPGDAVPV